MLYVDDTGQLMSMSNSVSSLYDQGGSDSDDERSNSSSDSSFDGTKATTLGKVVRESISIIVGTLRLLDDLSSSERGGSIIATALLVVPRSMPTPIPCKCSSLSAAKSDVDRREIDGFLVVRLAPTARRRCGAIGCWNALLTDSSGGRSGHSIVELQI